MSLLCELTAGEEELKQSEQISKQMIRDSDGHGHVRGSGDPSWNAATKDFEGGGDVMGGAG
jgi:hypothetical protein